MTIEIIKVPDIGADEAEVIEICVAAGDLINAEDSLVVLESDKASMEVPAPKGGKIVAVLVNDGDTLKEGDSLIELEIEASSAEAAKKDVAAVEEKVQSEPATTVAAKADIAASPESVETIYVPDIGSDEAEVIELCVSVGDEVAVEDSLVVLESDKASMEVPSPAAGIVESIEIKEGAIAKEGDALLTLKVRSPAVVVASVPKSQVQKPTLDLVPPTPAAEARVTLDEPITVAEQHKPVEGMTENRPTGDVYAGPAVRKMAREVGLDLAMVPGSGPKGRITKDDVKAFVKSALQNKAPVPMASAGGGIPQVPEVDFSKFGEIDVQPMSKMHKVTAANMQRSWLNVPHVTGFDEIDITELEEFRKELKAEGEKAGVKVTPLPFLLKAVVAALKAHPKLNASMSADGQDMVYKNYYHIGIAVDTPQGLMVPVIRDVDKKSLFELAAEATELAQKAKGRKLKPQEMQGGTFTISSLGPMGGTGFTPIVNAPEVAILGVSKLDVKPRWNGKEFEPRKMLPISLSYDHRAVNGADAGKFMMAFNQLLSDIRRFIL